MGLSKEDIDYLQILIHKNMPNINYCKNRRNSWKIYDILSEMKKEVLE